MTKGKFLKICFVTLMLVFCLHFSGLALAGDCAECSNTGVPQTVYGNYEYTPEWFPPLQYDPANPQTIQRNQSVAISVIGGIPPYTWSVSGTGFTLASETTWGLSNTLNADATA